MCAGMASVYGDCVCIEDEGTEREIVCSGPRDTPRPRGGNTVIVFDWDDTLLCSHAVRTNLATEPQLEELEEQIKSTLRAAQNLGEVLIVTNGKQGWVEDSAEAFLPGLLPVLRRIPVISARALYEGLHPEDPFLWKHLCFERLFVKGRTYCQDEGLNLIALGDQYPELDAAEHVVQVLGGASTVKTLKFHEQPTADDLIGQLSKVEDMLGKLCALKQSGGFGFFPCDAGSFGAEGADTSMASSWKVCETRHSERCVDRPNGFATTCLAGLRGVFGSLP